MPRGSGGRRTTRRPRVWSRSNRSAHAQPWHRHHSLIGEPHWSSCWRPRGHAQDGFCGRDARATPPSAHRRPARACQSVCDGDVVAGIRQRPHGGLSHPAGTHAAIAEAGEARSSRKRVKRPGIHPCLRQNLHLGAARAGLRRRPRAVIEDRLTQVPNAWKTACGGLVQRGIEPSFPCFTHFSPKPMTCTAGQVQQAIRRFYA